MLITDAFIDSYKDRKVPWGYNGLGYIVYKRTYARDTDYFGSHLNSDQVAYHQENNIPTRTEEWHETIRRCIEGAQEIGAKYTQEEAERLFNYMFNLKCSFGGRMLWQLGTDTVRRFGLPSLLNCWFISMRDPDDFCFLFEHLMLGGGVGFSVKREDIHELPRVKPGVKITHLNTKDADFIVPDSREGWVELIRKMLKAFYRSGNSFTYSTILVRGKGEPIKGFGGKASGAQVFVDGVTKIAGIFAAREGKKLRSIDVLDICNIIGSVVVAGNVRRSAEIAIGDPDDYLFLRAKRWDLGNIPNWRAMSNNSIYADSFDQISNEVWGGYKGNGEPYGFINLPLAKRFGRLGEYIIDNCEGFNPCAEIGLADGEACNLAELFLNNINSQEELVDCAMLLYKTQKAVWTLPALYKKTADIVRKNMRIGLGVTGIAQSYSKIDWLDSTYRKLRAYDKEWSAVNNWPESIKLTTVKPSGTLSLLAGATPGIHPAYAEHYIRRMRIASNSELIEYCRSCGYKVEYAKNFDHSLDYNTVVVEFPCATGENTLLAKNTTAIDQLELAKKLQTVWSDNSVSITVYYKTEELPAIQEWLKVNYENSLKSVSFLLHSDHGFDQAPYEEITAPEYTKLISKINLVDSAALHSGVIDDLECVSGACPVR